MPVMSQDRLAFDRAPTDRTVDEDGHMHVADVPISKATVNPYRGREIPEWQRLGLDGDRIYQLLRDPGELEKAAGTFNGKPLLNLHPGQAQTADNHDHAQTVGAVHNVRWDAPYLRAGDLHVWPGEAIAGIESGEQRELSASYRYDADMAGGSYDGTAYDGVMRNIRANHVALVPRGRAGSDVVVNDAAMSDVPPPPSPKEPPAMAKSAVALSRPAAVVAGALYAHARPLLATDAKPDFGAMVKDVTAKNFRAQKTGIVARVKAGTTGLLANDEADMGDVAKVLEAVQDVVEGMADEPDDSATASGTADDDGMEAKLKAAGLTDDEIAKVMAAMGNAAAAPAAMDDAAKAAEAAKSTKVANDARPAITQAAMDAAIARAAATARNGAVADMKALHAAQDLVRPIVGAVAMDSAEGVLCFALESKGYTPGALKGVPVATLTEMVANLPSAEASTAARPRVAMDSKASSDAYTARFGANANRLVRG